MYVPASGPVQKGGQSTYDGSIAVTLLSRTDVSQVLPPSLALAARTDGVTDHPVVHLIGNQRNPMILENGIPYPALDLGYQEVILLIPFVVCPPGTRWHSFVVRMYLNDVGAIAIGNSVYAYAKEFAAVPQNHVGPDLTTNVLPLLEHDVFESHPVQQTGQWSSPPGTIPNWKDFQTLFEMPLVGVDVNPSTSAVTRTVCSYWEWDYTDAEIAPATSQHRFLKQFRSGMGSWVGVALSNAPDGAMKIRGLRWRLAEPPPACQF
jgi:hypothetical protein